MRRTKFTQAEVLAYGMSPRSSATTRRHYDAWRLKEKLPSRCDNPKCVFHKNPLLWNGEILSPILDHINGNRNDNSPQNLRYLCPNCDSQLETRAGRNRGRIRNKRDLGYEVAHRSGQRDAFVFPRGVSGKGSVGEVTVDLGPGEATSNT